jgi:hypothetical protein
MLIKLTEPVSRGSSSTNWLLHAERLQDPAGWSRFLPAALGSDRSIFEAAIKKVTPSITLKVRKDMLRAGACVFEYDWNAAEDGILEHALAVAEFLQVELAIGDELTHNAA